MLTKLAQKNGKSIAVETLGLIDVDENVSTGKIWQLFSTKTLALRATVICLNW